MDIVTLLSTERIAFETEISSSKKAFEHLAELLCRTHQENNLTPDFVFDALVSREKLGSTTLGNGLAIPHACMAIKAPVAALLAVDEGLKMDAPDKKPVHLLFALLVPKDNRQTFRPLLKELAANINQKGLYANLLAHKNSLLTMDYLSSLFIRDLAA